MTGARRITAAHWWRVVNGARAHLGDLLSRAQAAEVSETGHACGHRFRIQASASTHAGLSGTTKHADSDSFESTRVVEVRAHNLADALSLAAVMPITAWFEDELNNGGAS